MKVRALKKRSRQGQRRAIRRRAFERTFCALGDGIEQRLIMMRTQWNTALQQLARQVAREIATPMAEAFAALARDANRTRAIAYR